MVEQFFAWLRFRLGLTAIAGDVGLSVLDRDLLHRKVDALHARINALSEEQANTQLCAGQVLARCVDMLRDLKQIRRDCEREPHFTLATAQTWESVCYSLRKAREDKQLQEQGDVKADVLQWTRHYMDVHGWPYPGDQFVNEMIHLHLRVEETRLAQGN